jgi:hypothetical protein
LRLVGALLLLLGACGERSAPLPATSAPLALLARPTLDGPVFDPASVAGKTVAIAFWGPG